MSSPSAEKEGKARELYQRAKNGDGQALRELDALVTEGHIPEFKSALAYLIEMGYGTPKDEARAVLLFQEAALAGDPYAMGRLGNRFSKADRFEEAAPWFLRMAETGDLAAMRMVAQWYGEGRGFERDLVQAARWFFAMLAQGNGDGIHEIHGFADELSEDEFREAARLAGDVTLAEAAISAWKKDAGD